MRISNPTFENKFIFVNKTYKYVNSLAIIYWGVRAVKVAKVQLGGGVLFKAKIE